LLELVHTLSRVTLAGNDKPAAVQSPPPAIAVGKAAPLHLWRHFLLHLVRLVTVNTSVFPP
jgi:hypothetical protein